MNQYAMNVERWLDINWVTPSDLPKIVDLELRCFAGPWSLDEFYERFQDTTYLSMVGLNGREVIAYWLAQVNPPTMCIHQLLVDPGYRRKGVGSYMLRRLLEVANEYDDSCTAVQVKLPETELGSQLFAKANSFVATEILPKGHRNKLDQPVYLFEQLTTAGVKKHAPGHTKYGPRSRRPGD